MRLICPNCDAQYEVDASAIPLSGRDVQCSNCGNAWFQEPEPVDEDPVAPRYPAPEADDFDRDLAAALAQPEAEPDDEDSYDEDSDDGPAPAAPLMAPTKRTLDASVIAVLREEAEHEAAARRADAASLEMQDDLGLPPPVPLASGSAAYAPPTETEKRLASMKGEPVAPARPAARRDLLPDIEEINSTLSPNADDNRSRDEVDDLPDLTRGQKTRSGFRSGFVLMLVLAGLGTALYLMEPQISQQIPGARDTMTAYTEAVDAARTWLDGLIRQATGALNGLTGNQG